MLRSIPLVCAAALAGLSLFPVVGDTPALRWTLVTTAAALTIGYVLLVRYRPSLSITVVVRPQHYVQAGAQATILLYWGWY